MGLFIVWILLSIVVGMFAQSRGHSFIATFFFSLILSPLIAFLIVLIRKPNTKAVEEQAVASGELRKCPQCAEMIKAEAIKCRYCGFELPLEPNGPMVGPAGAPEVDPANAEELMRRYEISRDGRRYQWRIWKYDRLQDAVAYAEKVLADERAKYG